MQKTHLYFPLGIIVFLILACNMPAKLEPTLSPGTLPTATADNGQAIFLPTEEEPGSLDATSVLPTVEALTTATADMEISATATVDNKQAVPLPTEDLGPPPAFDEIMWPEGIDSPEERDGKWYLNDQPVALSYHRNAAGEKELWLTLEDELDWPIMIQLPDGEWKAGVEVWDGNLTIVNTNEVPLKLIISRVMEGNSLEELNTYEITSYEILNLASLPPTRFQFRFQFTVDIDFDLTCATDLRQHSPLTFTIVPAGVAVSKPDFIPESSRDLDLRYSPLCEGE